MLLGITGGSGCGTSTVGHLLEEYGFFFVDADRVYRELLAADAALQTALTQRFGEQIRSDAGIDRKALAAIVFSDPAALADLNRITHAAIIAEVDRRIAASAAENAAVEAIALIESGMADSCDAVVSVLCDYETRLKRIMDRDGLPEVAARARLDAQQTDAFFIDHSDYVLTNQGTPEELKLQVAALLSALQ
jgi:dephospho-CoA kinase